MGSGIVLSKAEQVKELLDSDPDFIALKRFDFSIDKLLARYPDGCPNKIVAQAMVISEEQAEAEYQAIIAKIQKILKVDLS